MKIVEQILNGDKRAASRLIRYVDDKNPRAQSAVDELFHQGGEAYVVGFTGNPGSGKSTLVDGYISRCRAEGKSVGVIVVDPTSPFSGGAILGDRIRMGRHITDDGVFIRSVATRGNLGGLSRSTPSIIQILNAMKFDVIIIETVGVGQDEVDIAAHADTCVVVTVPGLGDDIQASKAGILEVASVFVVNKADRPESKRLRRELKTMLSLGVASRDAGWDIPVVDTIATQNQGIDKLYEAIEAHREWMIQTGSVVDKKRSRYSHLVRLIASGLILDKMDDYFKTEEWRQQVDRIIAHEVTPGEAVAHLVSHLNL